MPLFASLRARLLLLVAVALLPAFALIVWNHYQNLLAQQAEAQAAALHVAQSRAQEFGEKIGDAKSLLAIIAGFPTMKRDPREPRCSELLATMLRDLPNYGNLGVAIDGKVVCSASPFDRTRPPQVADRLWYRRALELRGFAIGEHLVGRVTGLHSITFGYPVTNDRGEPAGVAFAALDLAWLSRFVADLALGPGATLVVLDHEGRILARHPDHAAWVGKQHPQAAHFLAADAKQAGTLEVAGADGVVRLYAAHRVPGTHDEMTVVYGQTKQTAEAAARQRFAVSLAVMAVILLAAFGLAWLAAEKMVLRRARQLSDTVDRFAAGDLAARAGLAEADELGRFAAAFDRMADAVAERERRLERANRALRIINASTRELLKGGGEAQLLAALCRHIVREGGYVAAWAGRRIGDESKRVEFLAGEGVDAELQALLERVTWSQEDSGQGPVGTAIREERTVIVQDLFSEPAPEALRALARGRGFAAAAALPIRLRGEVWGAICMYSSAASAFRKGEIALLAQAADDLAIGLTTLRAQSREDAAREANRVKSEFLASMSHELRTPLNAIIGFSEVLRDGMAGEVTPQQREYLQDILGSGTHLLSLINDILDLSKVEAGKMTLELECLPVEALLRTALSIVREKAVSHRLTLELQAAEDVGELCADARKVKQILYNLLSNAVKFTPDGGRVTVTARRLFVGAEAPPTQPPLAPFVGAEAPPTETILTKGVGVVGGASAPTNDWLEIAVTDNGIGISKENQARLFAAFTQIDSSLAREYEGTGLGLALVKRLAELHGGSVGVESEPGQGATFRVRLPCRPVFECLATRQRAQGLAPHPPGGKVLVVEDESRAFELLRLALESDGFTVTRAANAAEARTRLEAEKPDLITLDLLLPGEDGWMFLEWLKKSVAYAHIPVVVISIDVEAEQGFAMGASAVLQKPFMKEDLTRVLATLGFVAPQEGPGRLLVVDDEPESVERLAVPLEAAGHTVERAGGGREAIRKALANPPDLILLDLMMPDLTGFDVVTALRTDSRTVFTPIVIVTARTLDEAERRALNGSVQAVLQKSAFSPEAFLAEVRRALSARSKK